MINGLDPIMTRAVFDGKRMRFHAMESTCRRFHGPSVLDASTRVEAVANFKRWAYGIRWRNLAIQSRHRDHR